MKPLKLIITASLVLCNFLLWAQHDTVTSYFDAHWNSVKSKDEAVYYRKSYEQKGSIFVTDYYKSGIVMLTGSYSDKNLEIRDGCFIYYNDEGVKTSVNYFKDGKRTGQWSYWNQKGVLTESMYYHNNVLDGTYLTFGTDGKVTSEAVYENGIRRTFKSNPYPDTQKKNATETTFSETMPEFIGGVDSLMSFLSNNIKYPKSAQKKNIEGKVILQFTINVQGEIKDVTVVKSVETSLDDEAVRVVKSMPSWNPGTQNGNRIPVRYTLPIIFKLN